MIVRFASNAHDHPSPDLLQPDVATLGERQRQLQRRAAVVGRQLLLKLPMEELIRSCSPKSCAASRSSIAAPVTSRSKNGASRIGRLEAGPHELHVLALGGAPSGEVTISGRGGHAADHHGVGQVAVGERLR